MVAQNGNPLTDDDVLTMVNKEMPESVIVATINSSAVECDTSTNELIRLNAAGVSEGELNAMIAAAHKGADAQPAHFRRRSFERASRTDDPPAIGLGENIGKG